MSEREIRIPQKSISTGSNFCSRTSHTWALPNMSEGKYLKQKNLLTRKGVLSGLWDMSESILVCGT